MKRKIQPSRIANEILFFDKGRPMSDHSKWHLQHKPYVCGEKISNKKEEQYENS